MADARHSWDEVGKTLEGLGLKLKLHAEKAREDVDSSAISNALQEAASSVDRAFDALGNAVRDPAVKDDVKKAATALSDAISTTFNEAVTNIRNRKAPE